MSTLSASRKEKVLWTLFGLTVIAIIATLADTGFRINVPAQGFLVVMVALGSLLLLALHTAWTLTPLRAVCFIVLAGLAGGVAEHYGLKYGTVFGGHYTYHLLGPTIANVPILIILYWAVFIYYGYSITNTFLRWRGIQKPSIRNRGVSKLLLLILIDACLVVLIDLFMDPLAVQSGAWTWSKGGPWFGIPTGNFLGWMEVSVVATGIYRAYEYFHPKEDTGLHSRVLLMPVFGYAILALAFLGHALQANMLALAAAGGTPMLAIVAVNLALYRHRPERA
jgi:uncharacterized membrane protein